MIPKNFIVLLFVLSAVVVFGQKKQLRDANKKFDNLAYIDAIDIYEKVASKGYKDELLFKRLGDAYYFNANYEKAAHWYEKLYGLVSTSYDLPTLFRYGQCLKSVGKYEKSDKYLKTYYAKKGMRYKTSDKYLKEIEDKSGSYKLEKLKLETKYSNYPAFYRNDSLFVVASDSKKIINGWDNEPEKSIFSYNEGVLTRLEGEVNTVFNEGPLVITKDGSTMYFSRNDYIKGKRVRTDKNNVTRIKIYSAKNIGGKWSDITEIPFAEADYTYAHPALSPDEKKLYFTSDMPDNDGKGGSDLYSVEIYDDGTYGNPVNLSDFNTTGNDAFPFVAKDGTFYFASNGHDNLGGLDIFMSELDDYGKYGKVRNIGRPINSPADDFAYFAGDNLGYFASNRANYKDNVYFFSRTDDLLDGSSSEEAIALKDSGQNQGSSSSTKDSNSTVQGYIRARYSGAVLENAQLSLIDAENNVIATTHADENGFFSFNKDYAEGHFLRVESDQYLTNEFALPLDGDNIFLNKRFLAIDHGTDIGDILDAIYFDYGKASFSKDALVNLRAITTILHDNPSIKIHIRSHADARGSKTFNKILTVKRAMNTFKYLTTNGGINPSRITVEGCGEDNPIIDKCRDGVWCAEIYHALNRRTEFLIIEKD